MAADLHTKRSALRFALGQKAKEKKGKGEKVTVGAKLQRRSQADS